MSGWIKLHRTLQDWGWRKSPNHLSVFIDLLLEANHQDGEYMGVKIPKGALTTSVPAIMKRTGLTDSKVKTILSKLEITGEIARKATNKFTMISIIKWNEYQLSSEQNVFQVADKSPTSVRQVSTNKNVIREEGKNISKPEFEIIEYYNQKNECNLRQVSSNYKEIKSRLKEGFTVAEMKLLIDHAAKVWSKDSFWAAKNRPGTLFNGKFNGYLQEAMNALKPKPDPLSEFARDVLGESEFVHVEGGQK